MSLQVHFPPDRGPRLHDFTWSPALLDGRNTATTKGRGFNRSVQHSCCLRSLQCLALTG